MFQNIGISEFVLIAIVALVLFGPDKMPEIGRKLGKAVREFRAGTRSLIEEVTRDPDARAAERRQVQQPHDPAKQAPAPSSAAPAHSAAASAPAASAPAEAAQGRPGRAGAAPASEFGHAAESAAQAAAAAAPRAEKLRRPPDPRRLPE